MHLQDNRTAVSFTFVFLRLNDGYAASKYSLWWFHVLVSLILTFFTFLVGQRY